MLPLRIAFLIISGDYGLTEIVQQMKNSKRVVCFVNPHEKKGNRSDPHFNEKLDDENHLLDIIKIMNYLAIIASEDNEVKMAEVERIKRFGNYDNSLQGKRLSNLIV
jgi:hypothetical protein